MGPERSWRRAAVVCIAAGGALLGAVSPASAAPPPRQAQVLATGLSSPKGLALEKAHQPLVSQGTFGPPGPIQRYRTKAPDPGTLEPVSPVWGANGLAYSRRQNSTWVLGNDGKLYRQMRFGEDPRLVADLAAFAAAHPDPDNGPDGPADESNAFGLAVLSNGNALVADSAANSVLRVTPSGRITLVARLPRELVATDLVGDPTLPPMLPAEAVPTGVTVGPDGHIYVGELKGFPFRPGSSRIWRIDPSASNAVCSADPAVQARRCQAWGSGFTSIASIAFDQTGALLVFEYAKDGINVFEAGCDIGSCPPAVLLRVANGVTTELAPGELSEPGWLAPYGSTLYLTDGILTPGGGRLLSIDLGGGNPSPV